MCEGLVAFNVEHGVQPPHTFCSISPGLGNSLAKFLVMVQFGPLGPWVCFWQMFCELEDMTDIVVVLKWWYLLVGAAHARTKAQPSCRHKCENTWDG